MIVKTGDVVRCPTLGFFSKSVSIEDWTGGFIMLEATTDSDPNNKCFDARIIDLRGADPEIEGKVGDMVYEVCSNYVLNV